LIQGHKNPAMHYVNAPISGAVRLVYAVGRAGATDPYEAG